MLQSVKYNIMIVHSQRLSAIGGTTEARSRSPLLMTWFPLSHVVVRGLRGAFHFRFSSASN